MANENQTMVEPFSQVNFEISDNIYAASTPVATLTATAGPDDPSKSNLNSEDIVERTRKESVRMERQLQSRKIRTRRIYEIWKAALNDILIRGEIHTLICADSDQCTNVVVPVLPIDESPPFLVACTSYDSEKVDVSDIIVHAGKRTSYIPDWPDEDYSAVSVVAKSSAAVRKSNDKEKHPPIELRSHMIVLSV
ncbi:hypothetical protein IW140_000370 [Coemansia sp. RSA 1813]|nr:hypothetical protein LPJ74_000753 [Coemansia sp. RSA 1843]KAJ2572972.1 hypothetical protein IW140_000370 [Coemansia sp. RSA 1813]